jgi:hypothetical protein
MSEAPSGVGETTADPSPETVARFLFDHPGFVGEFLAQHPEALGKVMLPSGHSGRTVSLHERQLEVLREKNRAIEARLAELMRLGHESEVISDKLLQWTRQILLAPDEQAIPSVIVGAMERVFSVPQVALRLWAGPKVPAHYALQAEESFQAQVDHLTHPVVGAVASIPPALWSGAKGWLPGQGQETRSVAMIGLRQGISPKSAGLLVLGSADASRFSAQMGTLFLERIAEIASAALHRLQA